MAKPRETILVLSAHSDDFVLGAGGTIAQYAREGKRVRAIVFSYGEKSHPWMKGQVIKKIRARETLEAGKILNCAVTFFDLREGHYLQEYKEKKVYRELLQLVQRQAPTKIFTHSSEDPHPDHRAVHQITLELYDHLKPKPEVYSYSIWNPVSLKTQFPALYVDVSATFAIKLKALKKFPSQRLHLAYPVFLLMYRAIKDGLKAGGQLGEHFFRIR